MEYRWSSYGSYAGYRETPAWLETADILSRASEDKGRHRKEYRSDVSLRLTKGMDMPLFEQMREGVAIGSDAFREAVCDLANDLIRRETVGKRALRTRVSFENVKSAVQKFRGEPVEVIIRRRGDWGRGLVLYLARRYCEMTLRKIGEQVGDGLCGPWHDAQTVRRQA